ncbi:permease [Robbsia andropogonis]|uniref:Permease n=1 Tax=Robbsia andropogonis TaxID=28092 RepID=A0A0F5K5L5_9BURK|nr:LPS export ABC transporter permease LptG [Robbsia andropogonis]KKB65144.1 permease [Robbsia andropogonis]MCP1121091.1 LPS export ABC transporter permease LptG [Robbsia andropogonis]MCP1130909.1 LPS export ABC transporter permease LptG [Robbsia andropogonis]
MLRTYERYIGKQIYLTFVFILFAFSGLFFFFDLISQLDSVGKGNYSFAYAMLTVALQQPSHFYEIIPVAVLISAIYVLAQMAGTSEFTILRAAGLSPRRALGTLMKIGVPLLLVTFVIGEFVGPYANQLAEQVRLGALGSSVSSGFKSGVWLKDTVTANTKGAANDQASVTRFVNVGKLNSDSSISAVKIYEFDSQYRLNSIREAKSGTFVPPNQWQLHDVTEMDLQRLTDEPVADLNSLDPLYRATEKVQPEMLMRSELTPRILAVLLVPPDQMSIYALSSYISHLRENSQDAQRYLTALWRKIFYPFAVFVMLTLSLPFAYLHSRAGVVGMKVFGGIMLGMSFQLINTLFSHIGNLNTWPAPLTAALPSLIYLVMGMVGLKWMNRN